MDTIFNIGLMSVLTWVFIVSQRKGTYVRISLWYAINDVGMYVLWYSNTYPNIICDVENIIRTFNLFSGENKGNYMEDKKKAKLISFILVR